MDRVEMAVEAVCASGVLLTPLWIAYKMVLFIIS